MARKTRRLGSAGLSSDRGVSFGRPRSAKGYRGVVKKPFIVSAALRARRSIAGYAFWPTGGGAS